MYILKYISELNSGVMDVRDQNICVRRLQNLDNDENLTTKTSQKPRRRVLRAINLKHIKMYVKVRSLLLRKFSEKFVRPFYTL